MELSARNQLKGTITRVKSGTVMAEVEVQVEAGSVVAAITDGARAGVGNASLKTGEREHFAEDRKFPPPFELAGAIQPAPYFLKVYGS